MSEVTAVALENDTRIISRRLSKGFVSSDEVNKSLSKLPDVEELGEYFDPEAEEEEGLTEE